MPWAGFLYKGPIAGEDPYTYWQTDEVITKPSSLYDELIADGWFEDLPYPPQIPVEPRTRMITVRS